MALAGVLAGFLLQEWSTRVRERRRGFTAVMAAFAEIAAANSILKVAVRDRKVYLPAPAIFDFPIFRTHVMDLGAVLQRTDINALHFALGNPELRRIAWEGCAEHGDYDVLTRWVDQLDDAETILLAASSRQHRRFLGTLLK